MFPFRDHNPSGSKPYVTWGLMAANILIFLSYWPVLFEPAREAVLFYEWGAVPREVHYNGDYPSLFTSMFLHGNFLHLAGNMLFLWIFGDNLEDEMGHVPFLIFYIVAGLGAGWVHVLSNPYSPVPMVGASGAIAAVMGGYLLMFPKAKIDIFLFLLVWYKIFPVPAWLMLGIWFAIQMGSALTVDADFAGGAYWAHAGGVLLGRVLTIPVWLRRGGRDYWSSTQGHPPHPESKHKFSNSRVPIVKRRKT
jgi:membrane associated rhomboid family serine protease